MSLVYCCRLCCCHCRLLRHLLNQSDLLWEGYSLALGCFACCSALWGCFSSCAFPAVCGKPCLPHRRILLLVASYCAVSPILALADGNMSQLVLDTRHCLQLLVPLHSEYRSARCWQVVVPLALVLLACICSPMSDAVLHLTLQTHCAASAIYGCTALLFFPLAVLCVLLSGGSTLALLCAPCCAYPVLLALFARHKLQLCSVCRLVASH